MARAITSKQAAALKRDSKSSVFNIQITLEYSIKLLEDYQKELRMELKDLTQTIRKAKLKHRKITEKLDTFK